MPNYKVTVKVTAEAEYEVEVEATDWMRAENEAIDKWRDKTPADFQVGKVYVTGFDADSTQTTWQCHECGKSITESMSDLCDEMCAECLKKFDSEAA